MKSEQYSKQYYFFIIVFGVFINFLTHPENY